VKEINKFTEPLPSPEQIKYWDIWWLKSWKDALAETSK